MADGGRKSKKEARYVDKSTTAGERCGTCSMFREPGLCSLVQGRISRGGWCKWWEAKKAKAA